MDITYVDDQGTYRAGACNIGPAEMARRRTGGFIGVGIALALAVVLVVLGAPPWMRLAVVVPLAGGLISLEQVRRRFCVGFAMAGIRNLGPLGSVERVEDAAARATDRRAALLLSGYMSAVAAVIAGAFALLPI